MKNLLKKLRQLPGWVVVALLFGGLYLTGLHTEVVGQTQRLLLATGLIRPQVPALAENPETKPGAPAEPISKADYHFRLKTLQGEPVELESLKGKVIFLNFWATWCPPCLAEMPNIHSLYEKMPAGKVAFVMVSLDEDEQKARRFLTRKGYTFPVYFPDGPIPPTFAGRVIPSTYVISPAGKVITRHEGMADYDNARFREFLLRLTQESPAG